MGDLTHRLKKSINWLIFKEVADSEKALADLLGYTKSSFSQIVNGKVPLSDRFLKNLCSLDENINKVWIKTGEGEMFRHGAPWDADSDVVAGNAKVPVTRRTAKPELGIPLIPIEAMAGHGLGDMQVLEHECEKYVVPLFHNAEFLITVKGSSMIPKYNSGDVVACKHLSMSDIFFQWNKVYVLNTAQGALIKRVKPGRDTEHILIVSDNERYEPFELRLDQVYSVAIVVGVIRVE